MNVRKEIEDHAKESDKKTLLGLFNEYHQSSQWRFVAKLTWKQYGPLSYEAHRVWSPTAEGRVIYDHLVKPRSTGTKERKET